MALSELLNIVHENYKYVKKNYQYINLSSSVCVCVCVCVCVTDVTSANEAWLHENTREGCDVTFCTSTVPLERFDSRGPQMSSSSALYRSKHCSSNKLMHLFDVTLLRYIIVAKNQTFDVISLGNEMRLTSVARRRWHKIVITLVLRDVSGLNHSALGLRDLNRIHPSHSGYNYYLQPSLWIRNTVYE